MSSTYIIGVSGAYFVTGRDGTVTLVPGIPITDLTAPATEAALLPSLVDDDTDTIYGGVIETVGTPAQSLLPAFLDDEDAIDTATVIPGSRTLAQARVSDIPDSLFPGTVTRTPKFKEQKLRPPRLDDDLIESIYPFTKTTGPVFMQPGFVASDDAIPLADVGWHLYADATVADIDAVYSDITIELIAFIVPEVYGDEESTDTYPFRVQSLTGGVPVPKPIGLTGSISRPRRLTGSLSRPTRLSGSIRGARRLTGSFGPRIGKKKR